MFDGLKFNISALVNSQPVNLLPFFNTFMLHLQYLLVLSLPTVSTAVLNNVIFLVFRPINSTFSTTSVWETQWPNG